MFNKILRLFICIGLSILLVACSPKNNIVEAVRENVNYIKPIEINSEYYFIDTTQKNIGYVNIYTPANWFILMNGPIYEQIIYNTKDESDLYKIPLSYGNGTYDFELYDSMMNLIHTETISIDNLDDFSLYMMSNDVVNFSNSELVNIIASELYTKTTTNKDYLIVTTQYVYEHIKYDINNRNQDMFATIDNILIKGQGVCYEKAKLLTALLRTKNIPSKLVFGNYYNDYHAWCEVYVDNQWIIADPTNNIITSIDDNTYSNRNKIF